MSTLHICVCVYMCIQSISCYVICIRPTLSTIKYVFYSIIHEITKVRPLQ